MDFRNTYKHYYAQQALVDCLTQIDGNIPLSSHDLADIGSIRLNNTRFYKNYPVVINNHFDSITQLGEAWDELENFYNLPIKQHCSAVPTSAWCLQNGYIPIVFFDVALSYKGSLKYAFQIVNYDSFPYSTEPSKQIDKIIEIREEFNVEVYEISADWILEQSTTKKIDLLKVVREI